MSGAGGPDGVLDDREPSPPRWGVRLINRVDKLLIEHRQLARQHEELEKLTGQVARAVKTILAEPKPAAAATDAGGEEAPKKGQPEWLGCRDVEEAQVILEGVAAWVEDYGLDLQLPVTPCWPWHPYWVVLLLAAAEHHDAAYRSKSAKDVSEFVTRVMPTINAQIRKAMNDRECDEHTHKEISDATGYDVHMDQLPDLAAWWATDRQGRPPGLTSRLAAAK